MLMLPVIAKEIMEKFILGFTVILNKEEYFNFRLVEIIGIFKLMYFLETLDEEFTKKMGITTILF